PPPENPPPLPPPKPEPPALRGVEAMTAAALRDIPPSRSANSPGRKSDTDAPRYQSGGFRQMPSKARAHWCSTPSAIAKGRNFSNISGLLHAGDAVALHPGEELLEAEHALEGLGARRRARRHHPTEGEDDRGRER